MTEQEEKTRRDFAALVRAIARELGGKVTSESTPQQWNCSADIETFAGLSLDICTTRERGKLSVSVNLPREGCGSMSVSDVLTYEERNGQAVAPVGKIGVSMERGAETLARTIAARLIPGATELYARAVKLRAERDQFAADKAAAVAKMRKALRCEANESGKLYSSPRMTVNSGDSVYIEPISVTPETALKIAALVKADHDASKGAA